MSKEHYTDTKDQGSDACDQVKTGLGERERRVIDS